MPCTYLAQHELGSANIVVIPIFINMHVAGMYAIAQETCAAVSTARLTCITFAMSAPPSCSPISGFSLQETHVPAHASDRGLAQSVQAPRHHRLQQFRRQCILASLGWQCWLRRCHCCFGDRQEGEGSMLDRHRWGQQPSCQSSECSQAQLCWLHCIQVRCK